MTEKVSVQDKFLTLDLERLNLGAEGVSPFYWPVDRDEILAFRDSLFDSYFQYLRDSSNNHQGNVDIATVLTLEFLREAMALFYSRTVIRRAANDGYRMSHSVPEQFKLMCGQGEDPLPQQRRAWRLLDRGIPDKQWAAPLRSLRNFALQDEFERKRLHKLNVQDDIISPAVSPLVRRHANAIDESVTLVPAREWFSPLSEEERNSLRNFTLDQPFLQGIIELVETSFHVTGENFEVADADYIKSWMNELSCLVQAYIQRLYRHPGRIPRRLWTGTGGIIWMRLLRLACKRHDGQVTGHEHGTASGHSPSLTLGLWEFEYCDRFITFSEELASHYREDRHYRFNVTLERPEIISISDIDPVREIRSAEATVNPDMNELSPVRSIMYINTIYQGENPGFTPGFPDLVWVDWQARVIGVLQSGGYEVFLKPHPEGAIRPPESLKLLADQVVDGRLEKVIDQADAFLFDWPQTTTFVQALNTCKPMVLIDFGFMQLEPDAQALLEKRCAVIHGWIDEQGRAMTDYNAIGQAFERAGGLIHNREYFVRYQGQLSGV